MSQKTQAAIELEYTACLCGVPTCNRTCIMNTIQDIIDSAVFINDGHYWSTTGNSGTVDGVNFIGTTDNIPFTVRTNNQVSLRIDPILNNYFNGIFSGNPTVVTGSNNNAIGYNSLGSLTSGAGNIGIGYNAASSVASNNYNIGIGYNALRNTTGYDNIGIGYSAGMTITTGHDNTLIGYGSDVSSSSFTNATAIGSGSTVTSSNMVVLGNSSVTQFGFNGALMPYYSSTYNAGTLGQVLTSQGAGAAPQWQASSGGSYSAGTGLTLTGSVFSLTAPVTVALGGTGTTTAFTSGNIVIAGASGVYTQDADLLWDLTNHILNIVGTASGSTNFINISGSTTGASSISITNTSTGTNSVSGISAGNSAGGKAVMNQYSTAYTTNGVLKGGVVAIGCNGSSTGLAITNYSSGTTDFTTNGFANSNKFMQANSSQNVAIGNTAAASTSAWLKIMGGTTTVAPLLFTSGTNLTSVIAGAIEYDGTNIYGTFNTTIGRWTFAMNSVQYATPTTGATVVATAQIAQLVCNPAGSLLALTVTFPANPVNGQQFDLAISQIITTLTLQTSDSSTIDGTITTSAINSFGGWVYVASVTTWFKNR